MPVVALDLDWDRVRVGRQHGYAVSSGDMTQHLVLKNAGAARGLALVIASDDAMIAERTILAFRLVAPRSVPIVVRARDRARAERLKATGASHVVAEYDEIGQRLIDSVRLALEPVPGGRHAHESEGGIAAGGADPGISKGPGIVGRG